MTSAKVTGIVHEEPYLYTIYRTDYRHLGIYPHRHIIEVPVSVSAAGFTIGLPLTPPESAKVAAGDWAYFKALARTVQDNPFRFNSVRIEAPPEVDS